MSHAEEDTTAEHTMTEDQYIKRRVYCGFCHREIRPGETWRFYPVLMTMGFFAQLHSCCAECLERLEKFDKK